MWDGTQEGGEEGPHYKVHYKGWKQRCATSSSIKKLESSTELTRNRPCFSRLLRCMMIVSLVLSYSWDEWVTEDRLKKYNDENIRKQKALIEAQRARDAAEREALKASDAAENAAMKRIATAGASSAKGKDARGQKRARDDPVSRHALFRYYAAH